MVSQSDIDVVQRQKGVSLLLNIVADEKRFGGNEDNACGEPPGDLICSIKSPQKVGETRNC